MTIEIAKKSAAKQALELIKDGMTVGLGSGTTAHYFIEYLIEKYKKGLKIQALASSLASEKLAKSGGIPLLDVYQTISIDLTVDGADEIDPSKKMIKGGGGALVREKIMAAMSKEMVVIIDETKQVPQLGKVKLPVEIIPYGCESTRHHLEKLGYKGAWRKDNTGSLYVTDNANLILDIHFERPRENPEKDQAQILQVPGVVDTGFFFNLAGRVIVGHLNGSIKVY